MAEKSLARVMVINFITSLIIALVTSDILYSFRLYGGMYLGNLFGLYFLVVYGLNNLVEAEKIPNNYLRFILAIAYILLFDIAFVVLVPLLFGPNAFPATEYFDMLYNGRHINLALSKEFYFALFAVVVLLFNFLIYRRYKNYR